jgi:hypothetical protein
MGRIFNYFGMVNNKTKKPHGYGRAYLTGGTIQFYDGKFKEGVFDGIIRLIKQNGSHVKYVY